MQIHSRRAVVFCLFAFTSLTVLTNASAEDKDAVHIVSGVVKHVDRDSRKVIVKAGDGAQACSASGFTRSNDDGQPSGTFRARFWHL